MSVPVPEVANEIAMVLHTYFKENLSTVLLYGSGISKKEFWDLDIVVILKEKKTITLDLSFLRETLTRFQPHDLDMQLFYVEEASSANMFSLDAHGAFFSQILQKAVVLYGENPFRSFTPKEELVTTSLLNRIQRYIFQSRQEYMGRGRHVHNRNPKYHQKHFERVLLDCMMMVAPCHTPADAVSLCKRRYPEVFSESDWEVYGSESDTIEAYSVLYEKVYTLSLRLAKTILPEHEYNTSRAQCGDIAFEYILPRAYTTAVVVVDGMPRVPELTEYLSLLASWGYAVFFPRLKGTWESKGEFLDHNPAEDITFFAEQLKSGLAVPESSVMVEKVVLVGAIAGKETLGDYIKDVFGGAYRCTTEGWQKLMRDELLSFDRTVAHQDFRTEKYAIILGEHDAHIDLSVLQKCCKEKHITLHAVHGGHLAHHKDIALVRPLLRELLARHMQ